MLRSVGLQRVGHDWVTERQGRESKEESAQEMLDDLDLSWWMHSFSPGTTMSLDAPHCPNRVSPGTWGVLTFALSFYFWIYGSSSLDFMSVLYLELDLQDNQMAKSSLTTGLVKVKLVKVKDRVSPGNSLAVEWLGGSVIPLQGALVWSLVKESRSCILCGTTKKKKIE